MLWFAPRSYLRWAGAVALVGVSWWIQLMPAPTTAHPYAKSDIEAGAVLSPGLFEMREVPAGLLPSATLEGTLAIAMGAGEPLLPSLISNRRVPVPHGWWAVELEAPPGLAPGQKVMLVVGDEGPERPGEAVAGLVIGAMDDRRGREGIALIAVPGEHLTRISQASAYGALTVAVAPDR